MAEPTLGSKGAEHFGQPAMTTLFPPHPPDKRSLQTHQWGCAEGYCKVVWRAVRLVKCFFAIGIA